MSLGQIFPRKYVLVQVSALPDMLLLLVKSWMCQSSVVAQHGCEAIGRGSSISFSHQLLSSVAFQNFRRIIVSEGSIPFSCGFFYFSQNLRMSRRFLVANILPSCIIHIPQLTALHFFQMPVSCFQKLLYMLHCFRPKIQLFFIMLWGYLTFYEL